MKLTPGMQQYMDIKNKHPDCIILFRMGDFYETFFDDAKTIARELEITLTSRGVGESKAPLAGIPYHAIDPYIAKLVKKGYKIGIVEQTEDPKKAKGLVKRELVRIITPGTVVESLILDNSLNNYILSFVKEKNDFGVSFCDISTGEFFCCKLNSENFLHEIHKLNPSEIIFPQSLEESSIIEKLKENGYLLNSYQDRFFWNEWATNTLKDHFNLLNLEGFEINSELEINSAGGLINYIKETQQNSLSHIKKIQRYNLEKFMHLDSSTVRNLELIKSLIDSEDISLLGVLDKTITPMGKRMIKKWLISPLINREEIQKRLNAVEELKDSILLRNDIKDCLKKVYDLERLIGRVSYGNCSPKDLVALKISLNKLPKLNNILENTNSKLLQEISKIPNLNSAKELIEISIKDEPSTLVRDGNIIKKGYNSELDELRQITQNVKSYFAEMEKNEKERTGIKSLKIKYNKVIGYFIEVTKSNLNLVPENYIRKQSQVNSERFVTEELKIKEAKILGAQEKIYELESKLFFEIVEKLKQYTEKIQDAAKKIAKLDCLTSFASVSEKNNYSEPQLNESGIFEITEGRHPVIEEFSNVDFITNDCKLNKEKRTMIITGPNMAGKSTYLRQNALICLMAQMGCFVPAQKAKIPIHDRIFSRIGAYDNLVNQQSTFMIEMNESANILNNATENSFVILDEIGRGTSTFDGVSLAWAIAEHLNNKIKCKTLFATHYHHLNKMEETFEGIENYNITIEEIDEKLLFLRKIVKGGTDKSYGIHVAKLAGVPDEVIDSAKKFMNLVEKEDNIKEKINIHFETKEIIDEGKSSNSLVGCEEIVEDKSIQKKLNINSKESRMEKLEKEIERIKEILRENGT